MKADAPSDQTETLLLRRCSSILVDASTLPLRWKRWAIFGLIALFGLLIRLPQLGARPMHTDEAINAYIVGELLAGKPFTYDPRDRHGPALAALALPLARIQGAKTFSNLTESDLRLTTVLAGTLTILLFGAAVDLFGFLPSLIAGLLFAAAPLPVYYARYFIHESIFVAATFGLILAGLRASQGHTVRRAALAAACAAVMLASKETAVLHFFALAISAFIYWRWNLRGKYSAKFRQPKAAFAAVVVFLTLTLTLFTWFGSNWKAFASFSQAAPNFLARSGGQGHQAPWWYYVKLVTGGWSGGFIFALSCIGLLLAVKRRDASPYGFLAYYAVILAAIYSAIPYKTPWLALNLWLPIALFAGLAIKSLWCMRANDPAFRVVIPLFCILAGAVSAVLIGHDTRRRVFTQPSDETNPYAYAHTSEDILGLPDELSELARQGSLASPRIAVIASDPWPLPWYLRHFSQVGFWQPGQQVGQADFYITSSEAAGQYTDQLKEYRPEFYGARPGVLILLWSPAPK